MVRTFTARAQIRSLVEELRFHMAQPNKKKSITLEFGEEGGKEREGGRDTYTLRTLDVETDGARLGPAVLSAASPTCLSQHETLCLCCH